MRKKRHSTIRQNPSFVTAAVLFAAVTVCAASLAFGQVTTTSQYAGTSQSDEAGGYQGIYKPQPVPTPTAPEELHDIIGRIYYPGVKSYASRYPTFPRSYFGPGGYGGGPGNAYGGNSDENYGGDYGGSYTGPIVNRYDMDDDGPKQLALFNERLLFNRDAKALREIDELVGMISSRGELPERLQRIEAKNAVLEEKLFRPVTLLPGEMSFEEFLEQLQMKLGVDSLVDRSAFQMEDLQNPLDGEFELEFTDLPAICVLELVLEQVGDYDAAYRFNNGVLEILPKITAERKNEARVYDVADLLLHYGGEQAKIGDLVKAFEKLFDLVVEPTGYVEYMDYEEVSESFLAPYQGELLVAYLPQHQHRQLEAALYAMRNDGRSMPRQQIRVDLNHQVYEKLQKEISIDFKEMLFSDVLDSLKEQTGLTFFIDETPFFMEDMQEPSEEEVSLKMRDQSVEAILRFLMRQLDGADFVARNGVVYIAPSITCERLAEPFFSVYPAVWPLKPKQKQPAVLPLPSVILSKPPAPPQPPADPPESPGPDDFDEFGFEEDFVF